MDIIVLKEIPVSQQSIYIPGKENNEADYMSRLLNDNTEWKLDALIFQKVLKLFSVKPEIDIFASHLNYQVPTYVSWNPDKNACAIDAFSISWADLKFYAFPPFGLIGTFISKIKREMEVGIMIIPWWVTQFLFPMMVPLLQDSPVVLPPNVLTLPSNKGLQHPLCPKMKVQAVHLSWRSSGTQDFHQKLLKLSWNRGDHQQRPDMNQCLNDGTGMQYRGMKILFSRCKHCINIHASYVP